MTDLSVLLSMATAPFPPRSEHLTREEISRFRLTFPVSQRSFIGWIGQSSDNPGRIVSVEAEERERDYASLYREIGPQLWRAILVYSGGRREIADDAVGEAFVRAMEVDGTIRRPFPWLYRTAFRIAAAELRRERPRLQRAQTHFDDPGTGELMRALRQLSPSQRAAVFLHYEIDLPVREVARMMGTSSAAVKVHLYRGRNRLRNMIGTEEVDDA